MKYYYDFDEGKVLVCPDCGHGWIEDDRYCRYCGAKKSNYKLVTPDFACIYGPMPQTRIHTCEDCGYSWETCLMVDKERFCPKCGGRAPREEKLDFEFVW